MTALSFARICVVASLFVGAALGQSEDPLKALAQAGDEYKDYRVRTVSLPLAIPDVSLRITSRVNRFAQVVRDHDGVRVGAMSLDDAEKQRIAKLFERAVATVVSKEVPVQDESAWRLLVVSGEGGGFMVGSGGMITAELFLLETRNRTLVAHSSEPLGKGESVDAAVQDLANEVTRAFKQMATLAATPPAPPTEPRPVLVRVESLDKGPPARVLVEPNERGGLILSALGPSFRMILDTWRLTFPRGSEFVFKGPTAIVGGKMLEIDGEFPALFKLADDGRLIWVAGAATFQDIHNERVVTDPARAAARCLELLSSSTPIDREEGAYSLRFVDLAEQARSKVIKALAETVTKDTDADVRRTAAETLIRIGDASAVTSLRQCAQQDTDAWCREVASAALARVDATFEASARPSEVSQERMSVTANVGVGGQITGKGTVGVPSICKGTFWVAQLF